MGVEQAVGLLELAVKPLHGAVVPRPPLLASLQQLFLQPEPRQLPPLLQLPAEMQFVLRRLRPDACSGQIQCAFVTLGGQVLELGWGQVSSPQAVAGMQMG